MSDGKPVRHESALANAEYLRKRFQYVCDRIEIAGSIRRNQAYVHDIEIVCIPKPETDLLFELVRTDATIRDVLRDLGITWSKFIVNGPHNKRFWFNGLKVDLYITSPAQWGVIYMIRTGSAEFAKDMVTARQWGGRMPSYMKVHDGRVWNGGEAYDTPEEADVFRTFGMDWVEPWERS